VVIIRCTWVRTFYTSYCLLANTHDSRHAGIPVQAGDSPATGCVSHTKTMQLKELLSDDDAVSPVIGVILMVAITVIPRPSSPRSSSAWVTRSATPHRRLVSASTSKKVGLSGEDINGTSPGTTGDLAVTHEGGDTIDTSGISIIANPGDSADGSTVFSGSSVSAGSSALVNVDTEATVRVTYSDSNGGSSATLGTWEGPDA